MTFRLAVASLATALALGGAPLPVSAQRANEPITLNFVNADIEAVARAMATITGRNIVVDPRVKGNITLATDRPVPPQAAFNQFVATLRLSGFTVVDAGGLLKVVPEAEAKLQGGTVSVDGTVAGSQIVTQIFRLNFENAANLVPILRPLISPNNTINVNPGNNSLVITDYADNLRRIGRIIAALDMANATDVEVVHLQHALASDLAPIVQRLLEARSTTAPGLPTAAAQAQAGGAFQTTVIAEPRSNSLLVRAANRAKLAEVLTLITHLDIPNGGGAASGKIADKINADFGSFDAFVEQFKTAGATQFGSGWAWLVLGSDGKLKVVKTPNGENPFTKGDKPLLTIDVWEHAYYLDYQNLRPKFIETFLDKLVNWDFANERLEAPLFEGTK